MRNGTTNNKHLTLFSGRVFPELAEEITAMLEMNLVPTCALTYVNSKIYMCFEESVHGCDASVIQSRVAPTDEWIMGQLTMVDALRQASTKRITVVAPFYPYACQNKEHLGREPVSARLMADLYKATGADRTMSVDLHALQIQGSSDGPVDHLWGLSVLSDYVRKHYDTSEMCVVSPDAGRARLADMWTNELGYPLAIIHKRRNHEMVSTVAVHEMVGGVRGRACILVDDTINTARTITQMTLALQERGASKIICATAHAAFSGPVVERPSKSDMAEIVATNTLSIRTVEPIDNLTILSIAPLIVRAINAVFRDGSMTSLFGGQVYK